MKSQSVKSQDTLATPIAEGERFIARYPRLKLLISLINKAVEKDQYQIAYEVIKCFKSDLLKTKQLPIFGVLFEQMKITHRYEAKIACMRRSSR